MSAAMRAAQNQGQRVEVLSMHTTQSRTWANPDGTVTVDSYAGPEWVQRGDGSWDVVDTTLSVRPDGAVRPAAAAAAISLANGATDPAGSAPATAATVTVPGDKASLSDGAASVASVLDSPGAPVDDSGSGKTVSVSVGWNGDLPKPTLDGNVATYTDAAPGQDLRIEAKPRGVETFVDLKAKPDVVPDAGMTVTLPLSAKGITVTPDADGGYLIKDSAGQVLANAPPATIWDAKRDPASGEPQHTLQVDVQVVTTATGYALSVTVPKSFLDDPALVWPVTVDPQTTIYSSADTFVEKGYNTTNFGSDDDLRVGTYDAGIHVARSYVFFPVASILGTKVTGAQLHLYEHTSSSCTSRQMTVQRVTESFSEHGATWDTRPAHSSTSYGSVYGAMGYSSSCPAGYLGGTDGIPVTALVDGWANQTWPNYGMALVADETDSLGWKRFYSSEHATTGPRPHLTVTYDHYPATPTALVASGAVNGWVDASATGFTQQLRATVTDGDTGATVKGQFAVFSGATQVSPASGTTNGTTVSSGQVSTVSVSGLQANTAYTFRAYGHDGTTASKSYATSGIFKLDTTKMSTPTASCNGVVALNGFTDPAPTTAVGCTASVTVGPSGVTGWTGTLDGAPLTVSTAGAFTLPTTALTNGWHQLTLQATNGAGARSLTAFGYGIGKATLSFPADKQSTADSLPVQVFAPAGVAARIQYLNGSTWTDIAPAALSPAAGGSALTSQPVTLTTSGGAVASAPLVWDMGQTFTDDIVAQVRACVMITAGADCSTANANASYTPVVTATLDRSGSGGASAPLGPVQVALTTGSASLSATDASIPSWAGAASVGRSYMSFKPNATGPFGPGWSSSLPSAAASDWHHVAEHGSYVLVYDNDGTPTGFTRNGTTYTPEADASDLVLTKTAGTDPITGPPPVAATPGRFTLTEPDGTVTTFTDPTSGVRAGSDTGAETYALSAVADTATSGTPTTGFVSDGTGNVTDVIAPAPPGVTCTATSLPAGCSSLHLTYSGGRVTKITWNGYEQTTDASPAQNAFSVDVACYAYDANGRLTSQWDAREQTVTPGTCDPANKALATGYAYDAGTGRLTGVTAPGLDAWTIGYDGNGRAVTATQSGIVTTLTYLTAADLGTATSSDDTHPDLSAAAVATWEPAGSTPPVAGAALFPPTPTGSAATFTADLRNAAITAVDAQGRTVNTAAFSGTGQRGWRITTTAFDKQGNQNWSLSAANRDRALNPTSYTADLTPLGLAGVSSVLIADALASQTLYAQVPSDRVWDPTDTYSPLHLVAVPGAGAPVAARTHTHTTYGTSTATTAPTGATVMSTAPLHTPLAVTTGATLGSALTTSDITGTVSETDNAYGLPDGAGGYLTAGWALRTPMQVTTQVAGTGNDVISQTVINAAGQTLEQRQPSFADVTSGTRPGVRVTTYYDAGNDPAGCHSTLWYGQVCTQGPATGHPTPTTTTRYDKFLHASWTSDSVGDGTDRVTTTSYANNGLSSHPATVTLALGASTVRTTTFTYWASTGLPKDVTSAGVTQTRTHDTTGRITTTSDGAGGQVTLGYDTSGRVQTITRTQNGTTVGTSTYAYDAGSEHRGLPTSITHSTLGAITGTYDPDGALATQAMPDSTDTANPITATWHRDPTGTTTDLAYAQGTNTWYADTVTLTAQGQWASDDNAATGVLNTYTYDGANRLTGVDTDPGTGCTRRSYGFDVNSNRTTLKTYPADSNGACQSATGETISQNNNYDAGDRLDLGSSSYYDTWGRVTTLPAAQSLNGAPVTLTYFADDLVATTTSGTSKRAFSLDPAGRLACNRTGTSTLLAGDATTCGATTTSGVTDTVNHYGDSSSDSPAWTVTNTAGTKTTTWYATGLDGNLAATIDATGTTYQLADLHGDVSATTTPATTAAWDGTVVTSDEYGVTTTEDASGAAATNPRYGWLGGKQRSTDAQAGLVLMGVRIYNPTTGLFLSTDPVYGGNLNSYSYPVNPVTGFDLSGRCWGWGCEWLAAAGRHTWSAARFAMNAPVTAVAYVWARKHGGSCNFRSGHMIACSGMNGGYWNGGTTWGNVWMYGRLDGPDRLRHETKHADQWALGGFGFVAAYWLESRRTQSRPQCNVFERLANLRDGHYAKC